MPENNSEGSLYTEYGDVMLNEEYRTQQERAIEEIEVNKIGDALPSNIIEFLKRNTNTEGSAETFQEPGEKNKWVIINYQNGISTLIATEETIQEGKNRVSIVHYYFVDRETGNVWDALQLVRQNTTKSTNSRFEGGDCKILEGSNYAYLPTENGGVLYIPTQEKLELIDEKRLNDLSNEQKNLFRSIAIIHESGHRLQHYNNATHKGLPYLSLVQLIAIRTVMKSRKLTTIAGNTHGIKIAFESAKQLDRLMERNAAAFTLNVIRRLKQQGLNLTRGIKEKEVIYVVEELLSTYDASYNGVKGKKFSRSKNKK